jgi:hypothetical protein
MPGSRSARIPRALVNIYKALGGGWVDHADARSPQPAAGSLPAPEAASR